MSIQSNRFDDFEMVAARDSEDEALFRVVSFELEMQ
jgi:hypothetical protein